jgi:hypothetical protein
MIVFYDCVTTSPYHSSVLASFNFGYHRNQEGREIDCGANVMGQGWVVNVNLLNSCARVLLIYSLRSQSSIIGRSTYPCPPADSILGMWAAERFKSSRCPRGVGASELNWSLNDDHVERGPTCFTCLLQIPAHII